jgi:hypothetical protein
VKYELDFTDAQAEAMLTWAAAWSTGPYNEAARIVRDAIIAKRPRTVTLEVTVTEKTVRWLAVSRVDHTLLAKAAKAWVANHPEDGES